MTKRAVPKETYEESAWRSFCVHAPNVGICALLMVLLGKNQDATGKLLRNAGIAKSDGADFVGAVSHLWRITQLAPAALVPARQTALLLRRSSPEKYKELERVITGAVVDPETEAYALQVAAGHGVSREVYGVIYLLCYFRVLAGRNGRSVQIDPTLIMGELLLEMGV